LIAETAQPLSRSSESKKPDCPRMLLLRSIQPPMESEMLSICQIFRTVQLRQDPEYLLVKRGRHSAVR
jgi:hypothetical protein